MRKLSDATKIRQLKAQVKSLEATIAARDRSVERLEVQVTEARRRTIPIGHPSESTCDANFLPSHITRLEPHTDVVTAQDNRGNLHRYAGRTTIKLEAIGEVVITERTIKS